MVKVVKIYLISEQVDEQGKDVDYNTICGVLWDLQWETREIKIKLFNYAGNGVAFPVTTTKNMVSILKRKIFWIIQWGDLCMIN